MTTSTAVRGNVVLIQNPGPEATKQKGWRIPFSKAAYIEKRAGNIKGAEAQLVTDAIAVHEALYQVLTEKREALERWAAEQGIDLRDSAKVVARFAELALEPHEKAKRGR